MKTTHLTIPVSDSIGAVSGIGFEPERMTTILVLAHGAGAGMQHPFMEALAKQLAGYSIGTIRFNFPFTENGKKRPDVPAVAEKTVAAALNKANDLYPGLPIFASGKSFGGRMTSQYLSRSDTSFVKGIILYGFPLHAAGSPATQRADHLKEVRIPMLFLQGTRDSLADLTLLGPVCSTLDSATLVTFDGANHSFKIGKKEIIPELVTATDQWITTTLK